MALLAGAGWKARGVVRRPGPVECDSRLINSPTRGRKGRRGVPHHVPRSPGPVYSSEAVKSAVPSSAGVRSRTRRFDEAGWLASAALFTFFMVVLVGWFGFGGMSAPMSGAAVVRVQEADTLWTLAHRLAPDSDPQAVVRRIVEINDLGRTPTRPGDSLVVPTGRM